MPNIFPQSEKIPRVTVKFLMFSVYLQPDQIICAVVTQ